MAAPTTFNITIDDTAPQIVYSPLISSSVTPSADLGAGWIPYFNGSGFNTFLGEIASGESLHYTATDNAVLSIGFTGTAIYLYGLADDASFTIVLDDVEMQTHLAAARALNTSSDPSAQVLTSFIGLPQADHVLSLTVRITNTTSNTSGSGGLVIFDRAVTTVATELEGASVIRQTINDTEMQFTGSWTFVDDPTLLPSGIISCHITNRSGDQAQYTFQGSSVELGGLTNASAGLFNVTLTSDSVPEIFEQQTLTGFSSFLTYTTLFYAADLDEAANYTLTVTNLENKTLALDGMNVTVVSGGNPVSSATSSMQAIKSGGLPRSTIAAISTACVLGVIFLLAIVTYVLWTRRRRRQWWAGSDEMRYSSGRTVSIGPRHRRVRSAETVDVLHVHPGQGLSVTAPTAASYNYRTISEGDNVMEISPLADSDSGHGHEQGHKKSNSISSFDNLPLDRPMSASPTGRSTRHRRSLNLGRWSGWFGSQHRSSFQSTANRESFIPDISIIAPKPTRVQRPVSLLARAHVRDSPSRGSGGSDANLGIGDAFLDLRRTSPFEVDFAKEDSAGSNPPASVANASPRSQPRDILVSFLDVASSAASSIRGSSRSRRQRSGSNKSSTQNGASRRASRRSQNSSGNSQSASTGIWSLSLSIDPQPRRQRHSEEPVPITAIETDASFRHPFSVSSGDEAAAPQGSPTDSIPMSVSDINFRVDEEDEEGAEGRLRLPRHPPLPNTPLSFSFSSDIQGPGTPGLGHVRQMSSASAASGDRDTHVAQTPLGRRLAEARAQAHNAQGNRSYATLPPVVPLPSTPTGSERRVRLGGNRARSLPFLNLTSKNHNGSS